MISLPKRIRAKDVDLQAVQENLIDSIERVVKQQILDGVVVDSVAVQTTPTDVSHKLGRTPVGYLVISKSAPGDVYDLGRDSNILTLQSSAATTVKLWVF